MSNTTKIVINDKYGGFGLSEAAVRRYFEIKRQNFWVEDHRLYDQVWLVPPHERVKELPGEWHDHPFSVWQEYNRLYGEQTWRARDLDRTDPILVQVVEELGEAAAGRHADLIIEELPKGTLYRINEYDGNESIETADSVDWSVA
jgi:hypothetical protein